MSDPVYYWVTLERIESAGRSTYLDRERYAIDVFPFTWYRAFRRLHSLREQAYALSRGYPKGVSCMPTTPALSDFKEISAELYRDALHEQGAAYPLQRLLDGIIASEREIASLEALKNPDGHNTEDPYR